jgi:Ca2+-binding RTX toxin-like protein
MLGGTGNDRLEVVIGQGASMEGGLGSDTYVINRGGAREQLVGIGDINADGQYLDVDPNSIDVLQFAPDITVADVQLRRAGGSLQLDIFNRWGVRERSVTISQYFEQESTHILDEIRFASDPSVVWRYEQVRALTQIGTLANDELRGGASDDVLSGLAGNDLLVGNEGNNDMSGGAGNDVYWGGSNSDTYRFGIGDGYDEIQESGGNDTVAFGAGILPANVVFYRTSSEGNLSSQFSSNADDLVVIVNGGNEQLRIANYFSSTESRWSVERFTFADGTILSSSQVASRLVNLAGVNNSQTGTAADDTFVADHRDDSIWDVPNGGVDIVLASVSYWLAESDIENLTLTGNFHINATGNTLNNVIRGNSGDNTIYSGVDWGWRDYGADTFIGGMGNDTYYVDYVRSTTYADYTNTNDTVIEASNEGYDTVVFYGYSVTLAANVERLVLWSHASGFDPATVPAGIDSRPRLQGNELNNVIDASIVSGPASLVIDGGAGADEMIAGVSGQTFVIDDAGDLIRFRALGDPIGNVESYISYAAPDFIRNVAVLGTAAISATGNAMANVLDGSRNTAANQLIGGAGDDTYVVDALDIVVETSDGGTDTVQSSVNVLLHDNVENLTLIGAAAANGTGNALANRITGNSAANVLDGGLGADQLIGGAGDDVYVIDASDILTEASNGGSDEIRAGFDFTLAANFENLTLLGSAINATGNSAANIIRGNGVANFIDGGTGNDRMIGGAGDDVYRVNVTADIVEENAGEGIDLVESTATFTLSAEVENLTLLNSSTINGTGNALDNVLTGNSANNVLTGDAGNDTLDGAGGMDTMRGGIGNDVYVVAQTNDAVQEIAGEGTDLVRSSVTYTLTAEVENLTLTGTSASNATGNVLANVLSGNGFNNTLTGAAGNDTLIGGNGADIYSYSSGHGSDIIDNFSTDTAQDRLNITNLTRSQVTFTRSANDLVMTRNGTTTDSVRVTDWFTVTGNQLNFVQFTDQTLTAAQINALFPAAAAMVPADADAISITPSLDSALLQFVDAMNHFGKRHHMVVDGGPTDYHAYDGGELAMNAFHDLRRNVPPERTAMW